MNTKTQPDDVWRAPVVPESKLIAIDPGDVFTGVAFFTTNSHDEWFCQDAQEFSPPEFEDALTSLILGDRSAPPPIVIYEKWRLYADHAKEKTGSEFLTSQHIGVIKYICRVHNDHVDRHDRAMSLGKLMTCELPGGQCHDPDLRPQPLTLVKQPADIKKPTAGILRHKKIKSVAKPIAREFYGGRGHVVDAELHGYYYVLNTLGDSHGEPDEG